MAEFTQPFNENDIEHFPPQALHAVGILGSFPLYISADAAFDARSRLFPQVAQGGHSE